MKVNHKRCKYGYIKLHYGVFKLHSYYIPFALRLILRNNAHRDRQVILDKAKLLIRNKARRKCLKLYSTYLKSHILKLKG